GRRLVGDGGHVRRSGARRVGPWRTGDAAGPAAVLYRVPEAGRIVRRLGGGLPAHVHQPERPVEARLAGDRAVVGSVGPLPLCPYHDAAVRRGEPAGDEHTPKHGQAGLWSLLHRLGRSRWPALLRGDVAWGVEPVMSRAEQEGLAYLFRLRMTANVKRALTKMMAERDWTAAGHGWQGKETTLRLVGWSRQRRVVLLRRKLDRPLVLLDRTQP